MQLYQHQIDGLKRTEHLNRVAYFWDMGTGKTFVGAEKMVRLGLTVNLIVCQKSKIQDWIEHFRTHYAHIPEFAYDLTDKKQFDQFMDHSEHEEAGTENCYGIINYELAWRRKDLLKLNDFTLMLDESSLIQNRKAKQTKFILKLQAKNVILLSGTPTSGKYENLWTQAHLLGWDISETLYNRQYVNWKLINGCGGVKIKVVDKERPYKNIERLKGKLREHGAQFLKTEDVLKMPEQNFIEVNVSKSKEYNRFMKDSIVSFDGVELVGDTSLTKRLYARQLCGQYSKEKLEAFRDLIESTNDRIIVFYNFTDEAKKLIHIANECERPWAVINGAEKNLAAYENYDDSITFVQYQAGAMGLNLQKANKIIYYSLPERCELFMQSQKRIHRIGQEKPCFYYVMMCRNSVEEQIYSALKRGIDFTDELFREECNRNGKRNQGNL